MEDKGMAEMQPSYYVTGIKNLRNPRWNFFFTQLLIVKHNYLTVSRAIEAKRVSRQNFVRESSQATS
jgi:hypothetical protein